MKTSWQTYLRKRGIRGPWTLAVRGTGPRPDQAVVIPCLAESRSLLRTLASLALNPPSELDRTLVVCVVNQAETHTRTAAREDNQVTLKWLRALQAGRRPSDLRSNGSASWVESVLGSRLRLGYVDASSTGLGLPAAHAGVGLARKIGMDLALEYLDPASVPAILFCLDADTVVAANYLSCGRTHFGRCSEGAAVVPYLHVPGGSGPVREAAIEYELFLRSYVLGLRYAGSPYAFHSVGSAMACTAEAYARSGGMNRRASTEDFYFLQNLAKTHGVSPLQGTFVYPEARDSYRVPFVGTGWTVARYLEGDRDACHVYDTDVFECLKGWLAAMNLSVSSGPELALARVRKLHPAVYEWISSSRFSETWGKLRRNYGEDEMFRKQLHVWFDGFRTLKMIKDLTRRTFPRKPPCEEVPRLFSRMALPGFESFDTGASGGDHEGAFTLLHACRTYEYGSLGDFGKGLGPEPQGGSEPVSSMR